LVLYVCTVKVGLKEGVRTQKDLVLAFP